MSDQEPVSLEDLKLEVQAAQRRVLEHGVLHIGVIVDECVPDLPEEVRAELVGRLSSALYTIVGALTGEP